VNGKLVGRDSCLPTDGRVHVRLNEMSAQPLG
jgi:hypothetical protein